MKIERFPFVLDLTEKVTRKKDGRGGESTVGSRRAVGGRVNKKSLSSAALPRYDVVGNRRKPQHCVQGEEKGDNS